MEQNIELARLFKNNKLRLYAQGNVDIQKLILSYILLNSKMALNIVNKDYYGFDIIINNAQLFKFLWLKYISEKLPKNYNNINLSQFKNIYQKSIINYNLSFEQIVKNYKNKDNKDKNSKNVIYRNAVNIGKLFELLRIKNNGDDEENNMLYEKLLNNIVYYDQRDCHSKTLIIKAVNNNKFNFIKTLFDFNKNVNGDIYNNLNIDINAKNSHGQTALMFDDNMTTLLMEHIDIDLNIKDNAGYNTIMHAIMSENYEKITKLFYYDCSKFHKSHIKEKDNKGNNLLNISIKTGNNKIIEFFMEHFNVNKKNNKGQTAIMLFCKHLTNENNHNESDDDDMDKIKTKRVIFNDDFEKLCDSLIYNGANIYKKDKKGKNALLYAIKYIHYDIIKNLLEYDDIIDNYKNNNSYNNSYNNSFYNNSGYNNSCYNNNLNYFRDDNLELLKKYKDKKYGDVKYANSKNCKNQTALMLAVKNNHENNENITSLLLTYHADVNLYDNNRDNALLLSCMHDNLDVVSSILWSKANINKSNNDGNTALINAVKSDNYDVVLLLLNYSSNNNLLNNNTFINYSNTYGDTALIIGIKESCQSRIIKVLVKYGADVEHRNNKYKSAVSIADEKDVFHIIKILKKSKTHNEYHKNYPYGRGSW